MARPAVVIVAFHAGVHARRCVEAVAMDHPTATIYLVDNESRPDQLQAILDDHPDVIGMPAERNPGFGAGANRGIEQALQSGATHVLLLNDDVYVRPGCIAALIGAAGEEGAASPWLAGDGDAAYRGGVIDWERGFAGHQDGATDYLIGGCLLLSRRAWERTGPFDETFFLYCEDVDWCLRARTAGVPLSVVPVELADHEGGASTGAGHSTTWAYWWSRNRIRLIRKHGRGSAIKTALRQLASTAAGLLSRDRDARIAMARLRGIASGLLS